MNKETRYRLGALAAAALLLGCGSDEDHLEATTTYATPLVVANAASACRALAGKPIEASQIGEPTSGAVITGATWKAASADRPNADGSAIVQATPDYCEVLVDVRPADPSAPLVKTQVNLPASWNGKKLQFGGSGYNGALVTGVLPSRPPVPTWRCRWPRAT